MLHLDASERLSVSAYLERLQAYDVVYDGTSDLLCSGCQVGSCRCSLFEYDLGNTWLGVKDKEGKEYVDKVLGITMT
jgi:hypothetical protein